MLGLVTLLAMPPMVGGKGGKGGKSQQKFSVKPYLKGAYEINVFEQNVQTNAFEWEGKTQLDNTTNVTSIEFEAISQVVVPDGENATKTEIVVHATKQVDLESDNSTHLKCTVAGNVLFDAVFTQNNKTGQYLYTNDNVRVVIHNEVYVQVFVFANHKTTIYEIVKRREVQQQPWYMKLLEPLMLVLNLFVTMKMKGKQGQQAKNQQQAEQPVQPQENEIPEDNDGTDADTKNEEGEEKEDNIKNEKKED